MLAVPGNHDLVWQDPREPEVLLLQNWNTIPNVQEVFWEDNSRYRQVVNQAFANYTTWWKNQQNLPQNVDFGLLPGDFSVTIEKDGAKLGIVGLDTAFLQLTEGNYEGKLALHTHQFQAACPINGKSDGPAWAKQHHACLLLTHHPPKWLNKEARQHLLGEISAHGRFAVQLCGHTHAAEGIELAEAFTEIRRLWLGRSLFGLDHFGPNDEGQRLHGYSAGRVQISTEKKGTVYFWPRKDEIQGRQRKLVPDYSFNLTDQQHTEPREFPLLQPYIQSGEIKKPHSNLTSQSRSLDQTRLPRVFHNLPHPDYGKFIGREAELSEITQILRPYPHSRHAVVAIMGIGGIGKSALALEIAHRYLHNYDQLAPDERFDAIIWISAKQNVLTAEGIRPRPQILHTLNDIYTTIAMALQREDITRASAKMQHGVVCSALTSQFTLLIVDNLESVDETVRGFLRELPTPTKAIITTRHRIDAAYPIDLNGMPWKDAKELIIQECKKKNVNIEQNAIHELYDRTGGVPLAIVWGIAQMGFGHSSKTVLTRLEQPSGYIAKFCFEEAIACIKSKPAHKLLMVLSLCADSASRKAVGYATELLDPDRDDGLVDLEKLSLVNKKGDRFWLLPLTKEFALSELQKSLNKEQLRRKWIEYFRGLSEKYSSKYWNWRDYDWLLTEGENILSIIDWAMAFPKYGEVALSFTRATKRYLDIKGRWRELQDYGEKLRDIAQKIDDKHTRAWICTHWLSWFYINQKDFNPAEKFAKEALSLYWDLDDVKGQCTAMRSLGQVWRFKDRYKEDEKICRQAMDLAKKHNYGDGIAYIHMELGRLARDCREWEESKTHWEFIVEWCEKEEADLDIAFLNSAIGDLGWVEFHLKNYEQGKKHLEKSLEFFEQKGGKGTTMRWYWRLANIEKALGNQEEALQRAKQAFDLAERLGLKRELESAQALLRELEDNPKQPEESEGTGSA